ncbi:hypothetical protein GCM10022287_20760 [Gryllotalpicola koreensis]|uniref:Uncharacterized protein n=1 Tax=Gryllotalpicola koreensis TaxID=993086 RepID=A0ABP8A139_9MICO
MPVSESRQEAELHGRREGAARCACGEQFVAVQHGHPVRVEYVLPRPHDTNVAGVLGAPFASVPGMWTAEPYQHLCWGSARRITLVPRLQPGRICRLARRNTQGQPAVLAAGTP